MKSRDFWSKNHFQPKTPEEVDQSDWLSEQIQSRIGGAHQGCVVVQNHVDRDLFQEASDDRIVVLKVGLSEHVVVLKKEQIL
jgi:hypothetical protein